MRRSPGRAVLPLILDQAHWDDLCAVNRTFNESITYAAPSPWQRVVLGQDARGDCKTYATSKFDALITKAWPLAALFIAECSVPPAAGPNHAVLLIDATCPGDTTPGLYVCSNGIDAPTPIAELGWRYWSRSVHDGTGRGTLARFTFAGDPTPSGWV